MSRFAMFSVSIGIILFTVLVAVFLLLGLTAALSPYINMPYSVMMGGILSGIIMLVTVSLLARD